MIRAIRVVAPKDNQYSSYSRYFLIPKQGVGLRLILDLHVLNNANTILQVVPYQCLVLVFLSFLQTLLEAFSTIKVYLGTLSACHVGFGDWMVGQHLLISYFMKRALHLHFISTLLVPSWKRWFWTPRHAVLLNHSGRWISIYCYEKYCCKLGLVTYFCQTM